MGIFSVSNQENVYLENPFSVHLKAIESTREAIKENNYGRAVHYILMLCDKSSS